MTSSDEHVDQYVDGYVHNLLELGRRLQVDRHCANCPTCRAALMDAKDRLELLQGVPPARVSETLVASVMKQIPPPATPALAGRARTAPQPPRTSSRIFAAYWTALAASLVLIMAAQVYYEQLTPGPYDLVVLGQQQLEAGGPGSLRVRLVDRTASAPVADADITVELSDPKNGKTIELTTFQTDQEGSGSPRFEFPDWPAGDYELTVRASRGWSQDVITRQVTLKRSWKLLLSSDKPVYQPGQTIRLRALGLRTLDLKPVAGQKAEFAIRDAKGNLIFKQRSVTSRFGISSADCPLADELVDGPYQISCTIGDNRSEQTVEVKRYVLPKFRVKLKCDQSYYPPDGLIRAKVSAEYFFGQPVAGGRVEIALRPSGSEVLALAQTALTLDESGRGEFELRLPDCLAGSPTHGGNAELMLHAVVTDQAGQEQRDAARVLVTSQPLRVELVAEGGELAAGIANRVYAVTTYADGTPASCRLSVSGLDREVRTNRLGVAVVEIEPEGNQFQLIVVARDDQGLSATTRLSQSVAAGGDAFVVRTNKAVYGAGETMQLTVLGAGREPVFVDLLRDRQTVLTQTVELKQGRGELQFDLPPEIGGAVELVAYRFGAGGYPVGTCRWGRVQRRFAMRLRTRPSAGAAATGLFAGAELFKNEALTAALMLLGGSRSCPSRPRCPFSPLMRQSVVSAMGEQAYAAGRAGAY